MTMMNLNCVFGIGNFRPWPGRTKQWATATDRVGAVSFDNLSRVFVWVGPGVENKAAVEEVQWIRKEKITVVWGATSE
jgi:hypothetical protein